MCFQLILGDSTGIWYQVLGLGQHSPDKYHILDSYITYTSLPLLSPLVVNYGGRLHVSQHCILYCHVYLSPPNKLLGRGDQQ